jgi:hypothetical protein
MDVKTQVRRKGSQCAFDAYRKGQTGACKIVLPRYAPLTHQNALCDP